LKLAAELGSSFFRNASTMFQTQSIESNTKTCEQVSLAISFEMQKNQFVLVESS
jgi:hypothetical protein